MNALSREVSALSIPPPVRSSAARAAHRRQASSHLCFWPVIPVQLARVPLERDAVSKGTTKGPRANGSGVIGPKQRWELACRRCAARAALDLTGAEILKADTSRSTTLTTLFPT